MKIFISYSRKDKIYKDRLLKSLSKLEEDGIAQIFVDERKIKAGDRFDEIIEKEILKSDIFLLLLSENFWSSDYIKVHELPEIQTRYRKDNIRIIPIVLTDTKNLFEYEGVNRKLAIPQGKAVVDFRPQSKIFNSIYHELKKIITFQDIGSNYHLLYLCRHSLRLLNPYSDLKEIKIENMQSNDDKSWDIKFTEFYEKEQKEIEKSINFNDDEKRLFDEYFRDIYFKPKALLVKVKDKLLEQKIINRYEILDVLNTTSDKLFPRVSKIERIANCIQTQDIKNLQKSIENSISRKILVYGQAGIGKTSTLASMQNIFQDDIVIIYDSFGAGTYKDDGEKRHKEELVRTQIVNELAIQVGLKPYITSLFIDLEDEFLSYLDKASKLLPNNKIIIIIDAADNNVEGARTFHEEPFIPNLWSLNLPHNCYLLMSARGWRRDSLKAPSGVEELELQGFDEKSSAKSLKLTFPLADENISKKFHEKTEGNPRVQSYLLKSVDNDLNKLLNKLEGDEKFSLNEIFENLWSDAVSIINPITNNHLFDLICLARPIKVEDFVLASHISHEDALKIIESLAPGITLKENNIGFLDEDFEDFLLSKLTDKEKLEAYKRISINLLPKINNNEYSAKHIAFFLNHAKNYDELIKVSLNSELSCIADRLDRQEIAKDRVQKALKVSFQEQKYTDTAKLLFRAMELAKSESTLDFEILQNENLDLLSIYTNPQNAINVLTKNQESIEAFNYHCAYLLAKSNPAKAMEHIELGDVWLRGYLDDEERQTYKLNPIDIAKRIATIFYIKGIKDTFESLRHWKLWFLFQVIDELPDEFLKDISLSIEEQHYEEFQKKIHPFIQALFLVKLNSCGNTPNKELVHKVAMRLNDFILTKPNEYEKLHRDDFYKRDDINKISVDFSELALVNKVGIDIVSNILKQSITKDFNILHAAHSLGYFEDTLYILALNSQLNNQTIDLKQLLDTRSNKKNEYEKKQEIDKKVSLIKTVFPYYELLAKVVVQNLKYDEIKAKWEELLTNSIGWHYHNHEETKILSFRAMILTKILVVSDADNEAFEKVTKYTKKLFTKKQISQILLKNGYEEHAYELIEYDIERESKEVNPANEKLYFFLEYAKLVKDFDVDRARDYFELAVESASGLDDNAYYLYKIISSYTNFVVEKLNDEQKIDLANRHINLAESIIGYLDKTENALVENTFQTVSKLDFSMAINLSVRWHDKVIYKLEDSISNTMSTLINKEILTIEQIFALRYFIKDGKVANVFLKILNNIKNNKKQLIPLLEEMKNFIRKHLFSEQQYESARSIVEWLETNNFSQHKVAIELKEFCDFYEQFEVKHENNHTSVLHEKNETDWDKFFEPYSKNLLESVENLFSIHSRNILNDFEELHKRIHSSQRLEFLERLCNNKSPYYDNEYSKVFLSSIEKWQHDSNVKSNIKKLVNKFISNNYMMFMTSYKCQNCIDDFKKYIPKNEIVNIILEKVTQKPFSIQYLENFPPLFELIKTVVSQEDCIELVDDFISRFENLVEIDKFELSHQENRIETFIEYLYKLMGHPDRRLRWKALHVSRELIKNDTSLIPIFLNNLSLEKGFPFTDDRSFYPIASKESLLILFYRLSFEIAGQLKEFVNNFMAIVFNEEFPHVLIQHIAKRIVFNLVENFPDLISNEEKQKLKYANEPIGCLINEKRQYRLGGKENTAKRFSFDSMDTIPYWYEKVTIIFNIDMQTVLSKAEEWIVDYWGQSDEVIKYRVTSWERENYYLRDHRHGTLPTIEEPVRHVEFHAMFLVVGKLLKNKAVSVSHYSDGDFCEYEEFLDRYFDESEYWQSELRDKKPLDTFLWGKFDKDNNIEKFNRLLEANKDNLVLRASYSVYTENYSESVSIYSSLVSSKNAKYLQNALQNTRPYDFNLPFYNEENIEIDEDDFILLGFFINKDNEHKKDTKDPYFHNQRSHIDKPCDDFIKFCNDENKVTIENWADEDQGDYISEASSSGYKIYISKNSIMQYLQSKNMDMIVDVRISTNDKKLEDKYKKESKIYILRKNGDIEKFQENELSELGEELVKKLLSEYSMDTYGRWLLHKMAEIEVSLKKDDSDKENLKKEHEKLMNEFKNKKDDY